MFEKTLNFIGGIPDVIMKNIPDITRRKNAIGYADYLSRLKFYSPSNWAGKRFLHIPDSVPGHDERTLGSFKDGAKTLLKYPSRYRAQNPAMAAEFEGYTANMDAYVLLWRHGDRPRPLVLCLHGLMMGRPVQAERMFRISRLYDMGLDVGHYVQPYHWKRSDTPPLQRLLSPENVPLTVESFAQNIHDLHSAVLMLRDMGYAKIGLIGASLGGYTSALYASFDAPVDFMFMAVPAINFGGYLQPSGYRFTFKVDRDIVTASDEALRLVSPLSYRPRFDVNKISVVIHAGDKLAEADIAREWIRQWSIPNSVEVIGGHWLYFDHDTRGKTWYGWLEKMGFIDGDKARNI